MKSGWWPQTDGQVDLQQFISWITPRSPLVHQHACVQDSSLFHYGENHSWSHWQIGLSFSSSTIRWETKHTQLLFFNYIVTFTSVGVFCYFLTRYQILQMVKTVSPIFLIKVVLFLSFLSEMKWRAPSVSSSPYSQHCGSDRINLFNCICMTPCLGAVTVSIN